MLVLSMHTEINNSQKNSRAICGALSEDCKARMTVGHIIGPAGFAVRLARVQIPSLRLKRIPLCSRVK